MQHATSFFSLQQRPVWHNVFRAAHIKERSEGWIAVGWWWQSATVIILMLVILELSLQLHLLWVTAQSKIVRLQGGFPVKSYLIGYLTTIALLCLQAWDPAESPGECASSPTAPSASPWASRATGAGGGDPGLWRWGARGPRRLLQRSDRPTQTDHPS